MCIRSLGSDPDANELLLRSLAEEPFSGTREEQEIVVQTLLAGKDHQEQHPRGAIQHFSPAHSSATLLAAAAASCDGIDYAYMWSDESASQDAEDARRPFATRSDPPASRCGLTWSELRGGDVWDRQIRKHIHDCALFIPIISATTQARLEGYFKREWKLAVDRTHDMADGKPFLVPVVIDVTRMEDRSASSRAKIGCQ